MSPRLVALALALLVVSCASTRTGRTAIPAAAPPPSVVPPGVVAAYHGLLPPAEAAAYCSGPTPVVIRAAVTSRVEAQAVLTALRPTHCLVDVLIEAPDLALCEALGSVDGAAYIEEGNELELAPSAFTPTQYGTFERACTIALRAGGYTGPLIAGGVYTCSPEMYAFLRDAHLPDDIAFDGLHCYNADATPQDLGHAFAVTEYGCPSTDAAGDAGCLAYGQAQLARFAGAAFAAYYQSASCAGADTLCHFGIFRVDGSTKPTLALVAR